MDVLDFQVKKSARPAALGAPAGNEFQPISPASVSPRHVQPGDLRLLHCAPANGNPDLPAYADYLACLLNGRLQHLTLPEHDALTAVQYASRRSHLIILEEPEQSLAARLCQGRPGQKYAARLATSVLVARQPCWPLHHLLLVLRLDGGDETAVSWGKRLAEASGAAVTILPLVPALPAMYAPRSDGVSALLSSQTDAGQQVREVARRLNDALITAVIHLRQGEPNEQIRAEIESEGYDLVLLGAEPQAKWQRWLLGSLVSPLLNWINRPVLVTRGRCDE